MILAIGTGSRESPVGPKKDERHILASTHHAFIRTTRIRTTYGGWHGAWPPYEDSQRLPGQGSPLGLTSPKAHPHSESPHEFSMRLAAHLCGDRPHRHHRARTKLVNLLTARTCSPWGSLLWFTVYAPRVHLPRKPISLVRRSSPRSGWRKYQVFFAAPIIWSHLKLPTTAMLMGIGET